MTTNPDEHGGATSVQERYIALWNEPDPATRHAAVAALFTETAVHRLQPMSDLLERARAVGFANPTLDATGHGELHYRVDRAHDEFVAPGTYRFRAAGPARRVGPVVMFEWEMVDVGSGARTGGGREVLTLAPDGRIESDYQFIDP